MKVMELGHVVLYVTNIGQSANFYKNILGFPEIIRDAHMALFSAGRSHHELLLIEVGGVPNTPHQLRPGLYHIGFKIGDTPEDAKDAYRELKEQNVTIVGTGDHGVTHSIYILDPDGNELELYADVSDEWKHNPLAVMTPVKSLNLE